MNKQNMQRLIDHLRATPPDKFNMVKYVDYNHGTHCYSPSCIAGHAMFVSRADQGLYGLTADEYAEGLPPREVAKEFLGITTRQAWNLFCPEDGDEVYECTPQQAANVCEHFMNTGVIDWSKVNDDNAGV